MKSCPCFLATFFLSLSLAAAAPIQLTEFTNILSFDGNNGAEPWCRLLQGKDRSLYGTTSLSGTNGGGTVFRLYPTGLLRTLHSFGQDGGYYPAAGLMQASDGNFYGTTIYGPPNTNYSYGTIFQITSSGQFTNLHQFTGVDGASPWAGPLIQGHDGNLYGTALSFPPDQLPGTLFRISTNGTFDLLHSFDGSAGFTLYGGLMEGRDGCFYGVTLNGGAGFGTIFKITSDGNFTTLLSFDGTDGRNPFGGLIQGQDGYLYGATSQGGTSRGDTNSVDGQGFGTIFKLTTNGLLTTLFSFGGTNGSYPYGPLMQASDGQLYGTTISGGANTNKLFDSVGYTGYGTLFRITTNGEFSTLYSFDRTNGAQPFGTPIQIEDGSFYATTIRGGAYDLGTIYRFRVPLPPGLGAPSVITNECGRPSTLFWDRITNYNGGILTAVWTVNQQPIQTNILQGGARVTSIFLPHLEVLPPGQNTVTLTVSTADGYTATSSTTVEIVDTTPPVIAWAAATPSVLWPPRGQMVNVTVLTSLQESCSEATCKIISVESPGLVSAGKKRFKYWQITGDNTVSLRAERGPGGRDRVYRITLQATDSSGNVSEPRIVTVVVPKNQPANSQAVSRGQGGGGGVADR